MGSGKWVVSAMSWMVKMVPRFTNLAHLFHVWIPPPLPLPLCTLTLYGLTSTVCECVSVWRMETRVSALAKPRAVSEYDSSFLYGMSSPDSEHRVLALGDVLGELDADPASAAAYAGRIGYLAVAGAYQDVRVGCAEWLEKYEHGADVVEAVQAALEEQGQLVFSGPEPREDGSDSDSDSGGSEGKGQGKEDGEDGDDGEGKEGKEGLWRVEGVSEVCRRNAMYTGRVTSLQRVLGWFPEYGDNMVRLHHALSRESGPLPVEWRHFVALMAVAVHDTFPLMEVQADAFLAVGGDPEWLECGLGGVPGKLAKLAPLAGLMARAPWKINRSHIAALVEGEDVWSVAELVHAIVIIASFHALASMSWGTGSPCEFDLCASAQYPHCVSWRAGGAGAGDAASRAERQNIVSDMEDARAMEAPGSREAAFAKLDKNTGRLADHVPVLSVVAAKFVDPGVADSKYSDFDESAKDGSMLKAHNYSWPEQGYSLVSQYYSEVAPLLDAAFLEAFEMTDQSVNDAHDVDTAPFRQAIWYYSQRLYGLYNDDHDYKLSSALLKKGTKTFVKKVARFPEIVRLEDLNAVEIDLRDDEKIHIVILAAEARKQSEILRGLYALMSYMMPTEEEA